MDRHTEVASRPDIYIDHLFEAHQLHDHAINTFVGAGWRRLSGLLAGAGHALAGLCHGHRRL